MTDEQGDMRVLRADAERNRLRLLDAASAVFSEQGFDVSVAEIARRAGIGQGTVFRRFPTKELLFTSVVERHMLAAIEAAERSLGDPDPWQAVIAFASDIARQFFCNRALHDSVTSECVVESQLAPVKQRMVDAAQALLDRAQEAGLVRPDVSATDLFMLVMGVTQAATMPNVGSAEALDRVLTLALDALRPTGASRLPGAPPALEH